MMCQRPPDSHAATRVSFARYGATTMRQWRSVTRRSQLRLLQPGRASAKAVNVRNAATKAAVR